MWTLNLRSRYAHLRGSGIHGNTKRVLWKSNSRYIA